MQINWKKAGIAAASSAALMFSSGAALAQSSAGAPASQCSVSLDRSAESGSFSVARHVATSGACTCAVTTGPTSQSGLAEQRVAALQNTKSCSSAPSISLARAPIPSDASEVRGTPSILIAFLAAAAAVAGIIIIADDDPASP